MLYDRGIRRAVVKEKAVNLEVIRTPKLADKKLIDEFTKDFKANMRAEKCDAELFRLGWQVIFNLIRY